jgi:hypothetical protein
MSINSSYNQQSLTGYYQLDSSKSANRINESKDASAPKTTKAAINSAFLLSLSPEAQDYLNSVGLNETVSSNNSASSFTLTRAQQESLDAIIAKYKGEPFTQETFDKLQNDLHSAGLSPDQLAQQAQVKDFNPTAELIAALNGKDDTTSDEDEKTSASQYDTQKTNYIQRISDAFEKVAAPIDA